jgi:hypothetical protein
MKDDESIHCNYFRVAVVWILYKDKEGICMIWRKLLSLMLSMALIISLNASLCFADKNKISDELLQ